jgi:hypothetical protein
MVNEFWGEGVNIVSKFLFRFVQSSRTGQKTKDGIF